MEKLQRKFIDRVIKYKKILNEVDSSTLEESLENFQKDLLPERELIVWERIAQLYKLNIGKSANYSTEQKKEIFKKILLASFGL
jgi:hypothetical protein